MSPIEMLNLKFIRLVVRLQLRAATVVLLDAELRITGQRGNPY